MTSPTAQAQRLAEPAPPDAEDDDTADDSAAGDRELQTLRPDQHELAEAWVTWTRTRNLYIKPSLPPSLLGRLQARGSVRRRGTGPDAIAGAELMAFHLAFLAQPPEALDRQAFELHYLRRVRNIKTAAEALGVSRSHWYRLVRDCRDRIYAASRPILEQNLADGQAAQQRQV
jgi:hypothetical protein